VLAAHRASLTTVILPHKNEGDLEDPPEEIRRTITFIPVDQIDQALTITETGFGFESAPATPRRKRTA